MSNCLIEGLHLLRLEVADDGVDPTQQLVNERHHLTNLSKIILYVSIYRIKSRLKEDALGKV